MKLTKLQRLNLELSRRYRDEAMTVAGLFWTMRRRYLILFSFFAVMAALLYRYWGIIGAGYAGVAIYTLVIRDLSSLRRTTMVWPVTRQIIDWDKVDRILAADSLEVDGKIKHSRGE